MVEVYEYSKGSKTPMALCLGFFDCLHFKLQITEMRTLVDRFKMHVDHIMIFKRFDCRLCLALIVRINESCCSRHLDYVHSGTLRDSENHIDGTDDRTGSAAVFFRLS